MRGWVCRLQLLLVLASAVILRSESLGTHNHNLLSQFRDSPPPGGPGSRIYIPQLYLQILGSIFIASYDSQGYDAVIRTRLHSCPSTLLGSIPCIQPQRGPHGRRLLQQFYCCVHICCRGSVFTEPFPSNGRLFWFHYSGFEVSCHNMSFTYSLDTI
jgi:hypothetical protein